MSCLLSNLQASKTSSCYSSTGHGNSHKKHLRAVNQKSNFYFRLKQSTVISLPIFYLLQYFFLSDKDHNMNQKSKFYENVSSEGISLTLWEVVS